MKQNDAHRKRSRRDRLIEAQLLATDADYALFADNPSFFREKGKKFIFNLVDNSLQLACVTKTSWVQVPVGMAWASVKFRTGDTYGICVFSATDNHLDYVVGTHRITSIRFTKRSKLVHVCVEGRRLDFEQIVDLDFFASTKDYWIDTVDCRAFFIRGLASTV